MKKTILGILAVLSLTSCATIISGSKQEMQFTSTPNNATVLIDGFEVGKTPYNAKLSRKDNHTVEIKMDGYKPYTIQLKKQFNEWYIGNIIFGGLIGLVVDPITGAIYRLTPKDVNTQLENAVAVNETKDGVLIAVSLNPSNNLTKIGQLEK